MLKIVICAFSEVGEGEASGTRTGASVIVDVDCFDVSDGISKLSWSRKVSHLSLSPYGGCTAWKYKNIQNKIRKIN